MIGVQAVGHFALFCASFARAALRRPPPAGPSIEQAWIIGVRSLPILLIIAAFVGTNLSLQGYNAFKPLGGERLVGMFVSLAGVRELAPIIAASMIAAKAGTEMASNIAVMRIQDQIDALEVMAVNPLWFLITPRLLGIVLVLPALTVLSICTMLGSAWAVAVWQLGLNSSEFIQYARDAIQPLDLVYSTLKAFLFGLIICLVSCYHGFHTHRGPEGVGAATNKAVVVSAIACVILNYFFSEAVYG